jgi:hypothetical protein
VTNSKDETSAMELASAELMADPMLELWHLLDAAKTEWLASDEPCDEKTALARAILTAGWRPPLPACPECTPTVAVAHHDHGIPPVTVGPEDLPSSPLPDSETEPDAMQWGYREHPYEDVDPVREEYARFRAQDEHLKLVQREVRYGPWIEVTS